jgi:hypothetical protein
MSDSEMNNIVEPSPVLSKDLSIYIPILLGQITELQIKELFNILDIGNVSRVDFVSKINKTGDITRQAFVHFETWYNTYTAKNLQARILDPNVNAKLVYDDPKFWPLLPAHNPAPEQPEHAKKENQKTIEIQMMQNKIRDLEETVRLLNFKNSIHDANITSLFNNENSTFHDSWVNLSGVVDSQTQNNKRMKYTPYHEFFGQTGESLYNSIRTARPLKSNSSIPQNAQSTPITSSSHTTVQNLNPSCCGQISDAWVPDYPPMEFHPPPPPSSPHTQSGDCKYSSS